ncbi:TMEM43 family protein [Desulfovibrio sp. SGI.169]|uniref:TMEM43 family protein n=1 Tax=Desulfovibrio sp. SGI.169 TaxID=3420561 RepID=UPI003CFC9F50
MADNYTEVTNTSWFSRLGNSFGGIGAGIVLIALATFLLYWNEGRAVRTGDAIAEAQMQTVELPGVGALDPSYDGKLVHATGRAVTEDSLTDSMFGITAKAIRLRRKVEYYQWVESSKQETRKKLGGGEETVTTYSYQMKWVGQPVDSQSFKRVEGHENMTRIQAENEDQYAANVTFGAYRLPDFLIRSISGEKAITPNLNDDQRSEIQKAFFSRAPIPDTVNEAPESGVEKVTRGPNSMVHNQGNFLYIGRRPNSPQVGDVRISFFEVPPAEVSIIAKISGDTFAPFRASNGERFYKLGMGAQEQAVMFDDAKSSNSIMTWILRIAGILLCVAGIRMIVAPLQVIADVIPLLGSIVGAGAGLVAMLLGCAWSFVVIAIAWIRFRPLLGACLLGAAVALICFLFVRGRRRKASASVQA